MTQQNHSSYTMLTLVLTFLRAHVGRAFSVEEICQHTTCTPRQVRLALNILVREEIVQQECAVGEPPRYGWGSP